MPGRERRNRRTWINLAVYAPAHAIQARPARRATLDAVTNALCAGLIYPYTIVRDGEYRRARYCYMQAACVQKCGAREIAGCAHSATTPQHRRRRYEYPGAVPTRVAAKSAAAANDSTETLQADTDE